MELSPILLPFDFLPERSQFFLDKGQFFLDKDLSFWVAFLFLSIIVCSQVKKEQKECFPSNSLETKTATALFFFFILVVCGSIALGVQNPKIAYCDGRNAFLPPPSPVQLPEEPVTPPEAPPVPQPVPQPVVIPQLAQPLISDDTRRSLLYNRYLLLNLGGNEDLQRMVSIIDAQVIVERDVEAALVDDRFRPNSILARYREIRGLIHSPQGELLSERTYHAYVTQIRERGTRQSVPYGRIISAIRNSALLLER